MKLFPPTRFFYLPTCVPRILVTRQLPDYAESQASTLLLARPAIERRLNPSETILKLRIAAGQNTSLGKAVPFWRSRPCEKMVFSRLLPLSNKVGNMLAIDSIPR
jgi:hypothetical protein